MLLDGMRALSQLNLKFEIQIKFDSLILRTLILPRLGHLLIFEVYQCSKTRFKFGLYYASPSLNCV